MKELSESKQVIRTYYRTLESAELTDTADVIGDFVSDQYKWRGSHPFNELVGAASVSEVFWRPLRSALTRMNRRMDIFLAGRNEIDGFQSIWVCSMGHLNGLFDEAWLGIPPTRKLAFLRYAEFHRIEGGKIAETAFFCDIPHLMAQAGIHPFPLQSAAQLVQPGPATHDGLLFEPRDSGEGKETLALINRMITDLGRWDSGLSLHEELARTWCPDMYWWGPTGIGATYTIERYGAQHAGPFRASFTDRSGTRHIARLAEGHYGCFFGWPNFTARLNGEFMGLSGAGELGEFRVVDVYRRDGDRLAENWVFIDLLHYWQQQGIDILSRAALGT